MKIQKAGENSIRITLEPLDFSKELLPNPALSEVKYNSPGINIRLLSGTLKQKIGNLAIEIYSSPLKIVVKDKKNELVQEIIFRNDGKLSFKTGNAPVLGMGEGGPKPVPGEDWRSSKIQFDRRGRYDSMQPRWQADAYGSRNPVPLLIGTEGWAIVMIAPWVEVDMTVKEEGLFIPRLPAEKDTIPQNEKNQGLNKGKGLPPANQFVPGFYDLFVFDAHEPLKLMEDISIITGKAVMPPRWALGYMQSHRTLENEQQMIGIVDTFRAKKIPVDAVVYLGTGFTPRGWNKTQPSFEFNPEVFQRNPKEFLSDMHNR
ncbi:MAG: TIM-barrel domain-containing protein, partial [Bacteroidota bacterium]